TIAEDGVVTGSRTDGGFCVIDPARYPVYFAARFDRPFAEYGVIADGELRAGVRDTSDPTSSVYFRFGTGATPGVQMKVGISYVSVENARANLDAENPGWDFDAVHASALASWNDLLGRVQIEGGTDDDLRAFYTALYHAFLEPALASDVGGAYAG